MIEALAGFTWFELWGPFYFAALSILSFFYVRNIVKSDLYQVTNSQIFYFFCAMFLIYLVKGSPISVIANNYLFSAHVLQLSILFFIATPLIILSLPTKLIRRRLWHHHMRLAVKFFAHPWLTAFSFNGLLTIYFIPSVFNSLLENAFLMTVAQIILLINAFLLWSVIITPVPEMIKISPLVKVGYLFFTSILLLPISFFLLVILNEHYPFYESVAGDFFPVLTAIYDQQLAGGILKITQLASYIYALLQIVMSWGRQEEEMEGQVDDENVRVVQGVVIQLRDHKK